MRRCPGCNKRIWPWTGVVLVSVNPLVTVHPGCDKPRQRVCEHLLLPLNGTCIRCGLPTGGTP